jgi:enterochelin esterase-like enzyme
VDFYAARLTCRSEARARWYHSKLTGRWRKAHVYTPRAGQARERDSVLYLQHGAGENETAGSNKAR